MVWSAAACHRQGKWPAAWTAVRLCEKWRETLYNICFDNMNSVFHITVNITFISLDVYMDTSYLTLDAAVFDLLLAFVPIFLLFLTYLLTVGKWQLKRLCVVVRNWPMIPVVWSRRRIGGSMSLKTSHARRKRARLSWRASSPTPRLEWAGTRTSWKCSRASSTNWSTRTASSGCLSITPRRKTPGSTRVRPITRRRLVTSLLKVKTHTCYIVK